MSDELQAFRDGVFVAHTTIDYDVEKQQLMEQFGGLFDPDWETPAETAATRKGLCRDIAIVACDEAWKRGARDVRLVIGTLNGHGHAWCEVHIGPDVYWGDPTTTSHVSVRESFDESGLIPTKAFRYDGATFPEEFDYRKVD